ncbi:MAG: hypothetical protein M1816_006879 [Peltula sp. TS41687]|nr:MAG: hypothetical protein M1816_006879 [Peltula sp. TS41687]
MDFVSNIPGWGNVGKTDDEVAEDTAPDRLATAAKRVVFDDQGDVLISSNSTELLVSSKILSMASRVFRAMLEPGRYQEGQTNRSSANPLHLPLDDDDPESLILFCKVLHFKAINPRRDVDALVRFVAICDKYDCTLAARHFISLWMKLIYDQSIQSSTLMDLLWAAYMFEQVDEFADLSTKLAKGLTAEEAGSLTVHEELPENIKSAIASLRTNIMESIEHAIEDSIEKLICEGEINRTKLNVCQTCGEIEKSDSDICPKCQNTEYKPLVCDKGLRVTAFLEFLRARNCWPLSGPWRRSAQDFLEKLTWGNSFDPFSDHQCGAQAYCPLLVVQMAVTGEVEHSVNQVPGLDLHEFKALQLFKDVTVS